MIIPSEIRKHIRASLACNWAGHHEFAMHNGSVIQKTESPGCLMFGEGVKFKSSPPPPPKYEVLIGESQNPEASFNDGQKIGFFGKVIGCTTKKVIYHADNTGGAHGKDSNDK